MTPAGTAYFVNDNWTLIPTDQGLITRIPFGQASAIAAGGNLNGVANPDVLYVASEIGRAHV